jgi:DNA-binding response OmpR family regulator
MYVDIFGKKAGTTMQRSHRPSASLDDHEIGPRPEAGIGRVLIVDDEPNVRFVFRTALESVGFTVDEAAEGLEALEWLKTSAADVVLLDLQMPGVGGMEMLRRLRDAGNDVPVVIVTAHGSIPDAVAAMKLGAIDFLSKPLTPEALRRVVAEVVARHAPVEVEVEPEPQPVTDHPEHPTVVTLWPTAIDLTAVKVALNRREFDRAATLLEQALDVAPESAEALTLMGVLQESRGQDHAAYHSYKTALKANPHYGPAQDNLRRYCERFGLDFTSRAINPAAEG